MNRLVGSTSSGKSLQATKAAVIVHRWTSSPRSTLLSTLSTLEDHVVLHLHPTTQQQLQQRTRRRRQRPISNDYDQHGNLMGRNTRASFNGLHQRFYSTHCHPGSMLLRIRSSSSSLSSSAWNATYYDDLPPFTWNPRFISSIHSNDSSDNNKNNTDDDDGSVVHRNDWSELDQESEVFVIEDDHIVEEMYDEEGKASDAKTTTTTATPTSQTTSSNTTSSSSSTSKSKPRKPQYKRKRPKKPSIPLTSSLNVAEVEALFDSMARHVPIQRDHEAGMDAWIRLVAKNVEEKSTLLGKLTVYDRTGRKFPKWMRSKLFHLFRENRPQPSTKEWTSSKATTSKTSATATTKTSATTTTLEKDDGLSPQQRQLGYAPTINRLEFEANVVTLMKARQMAYGHYPLQWVPPPTKSATIPSEHADAKTTSSDSGATNSISFRQQQWQQEHAKKSPETLRQEAEEVANFLADHLPVDYYKAVMKMLRDFAKDDDAAEAARKQKDEPPASDADNSSLDEDSDEGMSDQGSAEKSNRNRRRFRFKKKRMKYLCNRLQPIVKSHLHLVASPLAEFFYVDPETVESDPHVLASRDKWNSARKRFVEALQAIHEKLVLEGKIQVGNVVEVNNNNNEDKEIEKKVDAELRTRSTKDIMAIFRDENWNQYRQPVVFEALVLQDSSNSQSSEAPMVDTSQLNQMVFVDNLPIDIQETEIWDYFSRCGPISDVKLFNLRPEVDPGPLTKKQLSELRKKRVPTMRYNDEKWERPRSPVYGLITFADQEACRVALDDSLRIFGMVVRRHAVRTTKAMEITKLYIEGLPPEFEYIVDAEYELSQYLKPDIYICLQLGQQLKRRPWSCEIKFPSFESAYISYHKLQNLPMLREHKQCKLNWFRTPWNAPLYWTRQLGFDFT